MCVNEFMKLKECYLVCSTLHDIRGTTTNSRLEGVQATVIAHYVIHEPLWNTKHAKAFSVNIEILI
jgi:hypothetical protein